MSHQDNRIVVNLRSVQWARYFYSTASGHSRNTLPHFPTVRGEEISKTKYAHWHLEYPLETEYERAVRLGILDVWIPTLRMKLSASSYLIFTGKKAKSLWKEWNRIHYGK